MTGARNQPIESKWVSKTLCMLEEGKKKARQNEGITRHVHENNRDSNLPWLKTTPSP